MMKELRDLQIRVQKDLEVLLQNYGFEGTFVEQSMYRKIKGGRTSFHLSFIEHDSDFDVCSDISIRIDSVEDVVNSINPLLKKAEKARTATLGIEAGNLIEGKQRRWNICKSDDIATVATSIAQTYSDAFVPYIDRYTDLHQILSLFTSINPKDWIACPIHSARWMRALAVASRIEPERLGFHYQQGRDFLQQRKDFGQVAFANLYEKLKSPRGDTPRA